MKDMNIVIDSIIGEKFKKELKLDHIINEKKRINKTISIQSVQYNHWMNELDHKEIDLRNDIRLLSNELSIFMKYKTKLQDARDLK